MMGIRIGRNRAVTGGRLIGLAAGLLATSIVASPALAAQPTVTHTVTNHFHHEMHIDGDPSCGPFIGGVTEIADGNERLGSIDDGTRGSAHYGEDVKAPA